MEKIDLEASNENLKTVREFQLPEINALPFTLLNRRTNKTTKLVANSGETESMNGTNRWYDYEFSEHVFLSEIIVSMEDYRAYDTFEVKWRPAQGGEITVDVSRENDNTYRTSINQLVKSVSFKPPKKMFVKAKLNAVSLVGFQMSELDEFLRVVSRLDRLKSDIVSDCELAVARAQKASSSMEELRTERNLLTEEIRLDQKTVTDLNNEIGKLTEQRNGILADLKERENSVTALREQEANVKEQISARNADRSALASDVAEKKRELRALQDDINMFPTEISGFVSQAARNTSSYWRLAMIPILLLVTMAALLVGNAANLTTVVDEVDNARIFSILATRIPYVIIATAIIGAAYKLAAMFVSEIMRINQQRLNLSKVSIIATDVSKASEEGLDTLSSEEIYTLRTRLKMDMLRDHMKHYLSNNFASSIVKRPHQSASESDQLSSDQDSEHDAPPQHQ